MKIATIIGATNTNQQMLDSVAWLIPHLQWVSLTHNYTVYVGDGYGLDAEVVRLCKLENVPYTCVGINKHPRNGAKHYLRYQLVGGKATIEARNAFMVMMADAVICLQNGFLPSPEVDSAYHYALRFGTKRTVLKTFGEAFDVQCAVEDARPDLLQGTGLASLGNLATSSKRR